MKVRWLKVGPEPFLATCERCGGHVDKPALPMAVDAFLKYGNYAEALHKDCKPPEIERVMG